VRVESSMLQVQWDVAKTVMPPISDGSGRTGIAKHSVLQEAKLSAGNPQKVLIPSSVEQTFNLPFANPWPLEKDIQSMTWTELSQSPFFLAVVALALSFTGCTLGLIRLCSDSSPKTPLKTQDSTYLSVDCRDAKDAPCSQTTQHCQPPACLCPELVVNSGFGWLLTVNSGTDPLDKMTVTNLKGDVLAKGELQHGHHQTGHDGCSSLPQSSLGTLRLESDADTFLAACTFVDVAASGSRTQCLIHRPQGELFAHLDRCPFLDSDKSQNKAGGLGALRTQHFVLIAAQRDFCQLYFSGNMALRTMEVVDGESRPVATVKPCSDDQASYEIQVFAGADAGLILACAQSLYQIQRLAKLKARAVEPSCEEDSDSDLSAASDDDM